MPVATTADSQPWPVAADLEFLTSPAAAGRLSGTPGAEAAARFLAGRLAAAGLRPPGDSYLVPVQVPAARLAGPVRLAVGREAFRHRLDFGEMAHVSAGGTYAGPLLPVAAGQAVAAGDVAGQVILVAEPPAGFDPGATAAAAADLGAVALLVGAGEPPWFSKTVYGSPGARLPVIRLRAGLARSLAARRGATVRLELPLQAGPRSCHNVLGLLPGRGPDRAVVLSAHYDHVGDDPGGARFPGAHDNASGVAAVLAAARELAAAPAPLPFHLMVALLTGEESGLWGARALAARPPLPLAAVVNVDGVGLEPGPGALRLGHAAPGHWLPGLAAGVLAARGVAPRWVAGHDDSAAFLQAGIPTVGLGQQPSGTPPGFLHTPDDRLGALHIPQVAAAGRLLAALVRRLADQSIQGGLIHG